MQMRHVARHTRCLMVHEERRHRDGPSSPPHTCGAKGVGLVVYGFDFSAAIWRGRFDCGLISWPAAGAAGGNPAERENFVRIFVEKCRI